MSTQTGTNISKQDVTWRASKRAMRSKDFILGIIASTRLRVDDKVSAGLLLENWAKKSPNSIAIKFGEKQWTYSEFNCFANQYADMFRILGVTKNDSVALNIRNCPELLFAIMGAAKLGAVSALINTTQTGSVLCHSLALANPKVILIGSEQASNFNAVELSKINGYSGPLLWIKNSDDPMPTGFEDANRLLIESSDKDRPESKNVTLGDRAFLIFTSGTTGLPKASIISWKKWYTSANLFSKSVLSLKQSDVMYCCLPLYHSNALTIAFAPTLFAGATLALSPKFSASKFWDDCRKYNVTCFSYIGELLRYLLNQPEKYNDNFHKVTRITGNGLRPDLWDRFKTRFSINEIYEFYGATEAPAAFVNYFNYDRTVGWNPAGWEIVAYDVDAEEPVRDSNGKMIKLGPGKTGLLLTKITDFQKFDGYTDRHASEKKLIRNAFEDGDCWFNTGDLLKSLGAGHAQFIDRVGDTFRWSGENVATTEVEAVINAWHQTQDSVVYGVEVPNYDGRCGMVSITPHSGNEFDLDAFKQFLRERLPKYAVPRFLRFQQHQVTTGTFKHQKAMLKTQGYDTDKIKEAVWLLTPDADAWKLLTAEIIIKINKGEIRL